MTFFIREKSTANYLKGEKDELQILRVKEFVFICGFGHFSPIQQFSALKQTS
jgi:hypothetical protein